MDVSRVIRGRKAQFLSSVIILMLAACADQQSTAPQLSQGDQSLGAPCPAVGLRLSDSIGRDFVFQGRDPNDPEVCLWAIVGRNQRFRLLYGLVDADPAAFGSDRHQVARPAFRRLFPLSAGKRAEFVSRAPQNGWRNTYAVLDEQKITVPAGTFQTFVLLHEEQGMWGNTFHNRRTFFIDKETGIPVRMDVQHISGNPAGIQPWVAVRISR